MRVVYLLRKTVPSTETITLQAVTMAAEMARAGADVDLLVPELGAGDLLAAYGVEPAPRLRVTELRSAWNPRYNRWRGVPFRLALARVLLARAPGTTVVYSRGERALEVAAGLIARRERLGVPVVYEAHKLYRAYHADREGADRKILRARRLERAVYREADGLVAISRPLEEAIREETDSCVPIRVIPNGATPNPDADRVPREFDVVYAGDLARWKGVETLVDALERLPGRSLRILGGRDPRRVEELRRDVASRGLADRITVEGPRPASEIPPILARTKVVAVPLPGDNAQAASFTSPLKLFQALEAGCAVVASDLPSIREVVVHDRDALLVPPDEPAALAARIEAVLLDDVLRARLATRGRATAAAYHWSRRADAVLGFLEELSIPDCRSRMLDSGG